MEWRLAARALVVEVRILALELIILMLELRNFVLRAFEFELCSLKLSFYCPTRSFHSRIFAD